MPAASRWPARTFAPLSFFGFVLICGTADELAADQQCKSTVPCSRFEMDSHLPAARQLDCSFAAPSCLTSLNQFSGNDRWQSFVLHMASAALKLIGAKMVEQSLKKLTEWGVGALDWTAAFNDSYCATWSSFPWPDTDEDLKSVQERLSALGELNQLPVVMVHVNEISDGVGARFKKEMEIVAAALRMGFDGVVTHFGLENIWCHSSPAEGPSTPNPRAPSFPHICWPSDFLKDFVGQSPRAAVRTLLWGAPTRSQAVLSAKSEEPSQRFNCLDVAYLPGAKDRKGGPLLAGLFEGPPRFKDDAPWRFLRKHGFPREASQRLFASARSFAQPSRDLGESRRETLCGFGDTSAVHVAVHVRRGDTGDEASYSATTSLGPKGFAAWLCDLAEALGAGKRQLQLHVYTEAAGFSRRKFRRRKPKGFDLKPEPSDDAEPIFHFNGSFSMPPACDSVQPFVHFVSNNNPREALLCMARADVLVTSRSSLSWAAAVLSTGPVFHPKPQRPHLVHYDLRDQYLDWADNWFYLEDAQPGASRREAVRSFFAGV